MTDRMPPIPREQWTDAQAKAAEEFSRMRGQEVFGPFALMLRSPEVMLRAAAMGTVALLGLGSRGRDQGVRALGLALLVLLLVDPWLALSLGFVLSTLATAGILLMGPPFRDALQSWMPRWAAEALAVPFAAQLACTPVIAAISGRALAAAARRAGYRPLVADFFCDTDTVALAERVGKLPGDLHSGIDGARIVAAYRVLNPDKLRRVEAATALV